MRFAVDDSGYNGYDAGVSKESVLGLLFVGSSTADRIGCKFAALEVNNLWDRQLLQTREVSPTREAEE